MELSKEQWQQVKNHCESVGLQFISSPFSIAAVELLESIGTTMYKVGSGEIGNSLLLHRLCQTGKPLLISSGMSNYAELDAVVNYMQQQHSQYVLMQCTTAYPTPPGQWGLGRIAEMQQRYKQPIGFSDHSGTPASAIAAAALGAVCIEVHAVFDKRMFGPDAKASLTIDEITNLVTSVRHIAQDLSAPSLKNEVPENFTALRQMFGKSLAVNKSLAAGHTLQLSDLETKKPADKGIPAAVFAEVLGKTLQHPLDQWSFLQWSDLA